MRGPTFVASCARVIACIVLSGFCLALPLVKSNLSLDPKRNSYVHLVRGELEANGTKLATGDAALLEGESQLRLGAAKDAEVLVFDLAA